VRAREGVTFGEARSSTSVARSVQQSDANAMQFVERVVAAVGTQPSDEEST
jgi:hypothetical protein